MSRRLSARDRLRPTHETTVGEAANDLVRLSVDRGCRVREIIFADRLDRTSSERLAGAVLSAYVEACSRYTRSGAIGQELTPFRLPAPIPLGERGATSEPEPVPVPTPKPSTAAIQAFERRLQQQLDELALRAKEEADRLEQVTATRQTPYATVTVTASGRLRRVAFHPLAIDLGGDVLAADLLEALAVAETEAALSATTDKQSTPPAQAGSQRQSRPRSAAAGTRTGRRRSRR